MGIGDEKYVSLTTTKRDGSAVATAVWIVPLDDGRVGFWTSSSSGRAKRIRHTPAVLLQPCDSRGRVTAGSSTVAGTATLASSGAEADEIRRKVKAKYGIMVPISKFFNKIGALIKRKKQPYGDTAVLITLDGA